MKKVVFVIVVFTILGCNNTPKVLSYGSEGCHFCSMTIVDKQHAAQFMTKKGRTYSFDAIECMMNHLKEIETNDVAIFLANDYQSPGEFIEASNATYLISENIPSPMGEFLSAFSTQGAAEMVQQENQGEIFSWQELKERFKL